MDIDEDDDFYAPEESAPLSLNQAVPAEVAQPGVKPEQKDEDVEEGEDDDEGDDSDSDIDIITEKKEGAPQPTKPKGADYNDLPGQTKSTTGADAKASIVKTEQPKKGSEPETSAVSGAELPGLAISKIDVNAKPMYEPAGKPITQINIDEDLNENDKPWRRPGTDISDYFNYGFDEFTWALYANKQESLRSEFDPNKIAQNNKKMFEDMNIMMAMGGLPGMPAGGMPGMEGMTPEMMQQMQQMMASGMDPSQMDPSMFGGSSSAGGASGFGGGGQFGGGGFDQGMMGSGGDSSNRGGGFGRGRGRRGRGNW